MAKKEKTARAQQPKETLDRKKLSELMSEPKAYEEKYLIGEEHYTVTFISHIPAVQRALLLNRVEALYFVDDEYDVAYGDASARFIIARMYTTEDFEDDLDVFERFAGMTSFELDLPDEAMGLLSAVRAKADFIAKKRAFPDAQQKMYEDMTKLCGSISKVMQTAVAYLDMAEKQMEKDSDVSMNDMVKALQELGKKDERKITAAILDYQAEKAKKRAVEKPETVK